MKYEEAYSFIEECNILGSALGLTSIKELTNELGNPQDSLKFVHIAGTNGKGSVLAYLSSILHMEGKKVGRYISPTIFTYRERFQINGRMISKKDFGFYLERVKEACERMVARGFNHPTSFEIETALAFLYFKEKECEIVVLETGMGGTLDATNIVKTTVVSVLASISMDHMQFLGNSLAKIAQEKCGIIKENIPVVTMQQAPEVMEIIENICKQKNAPLIVADSSSLKQKKYGLLKQSFSYEGEKYEIKIAGLCQFENALLAIKAAQTLGVSLKSIKKGLAGAEWKGRFSVIGKNPYFIADGAHNEDAAKKLMESMHFYFTNRRIIYIMGMFKDKEYEKVIELTAPAADQIITVAAPHNPRALPAYELAQAVSAVNPHVTAADSLEEAVEMSYLFAEKDSVILAFGSLSYLGELMTIVEKGSAVRSDTHGK